MSIDNVTASRFQQPAVPALCSQADQPINSVGEPFGIPSMKRTLMSRIGCIVAARIGCAEKKERANTRLAAFAVAMLLSLAALPAVAQSVTYVGGNSATAKGSGLSGTPTLSFTVQPGQNRIVFITAAFERDHCTTASSETLANCADDATANSNFAAPTLVTLNGSNVPISFTITGPSGNTTVQNPLTPPAGDLRFGNRYQTSAGATTSPADSLYSLESYFTALYESQLRTLGCTSTAACSLTISLPNVVAPKRPGDEAMLVAQQFNNVNQRSDGSGTSGTVSGTGIVRSLVNTGSPSLCSPGGNNDPGASPGNWSVCPGSYDAGQSPQNAGDGVLLFGINGYARTGTAMDFLASPSFTEVMNPNVINDDPAGANYLTNNESDGFSTSFQFANGSVATLPASNIKLQSQNGSLGAGDVVSGGFMAGFTLTRATVDLSLTKTNTPGVNSNADQVSDTVAQGATDNVYTIVVTNKSLYDYINGAVLTDPVGTNITKTGAVTCTASSAQSECPTVGALTTAALEGAGITIPTIAPNSTMTFTVTTTVAAVPVGTFATNTATVTLPAPYADATPADNTKTDSDLILGRIVIIKDAQPNAPGVNFNFTAVGTGVSNFALIDDGTAPGPGVANTKVFDVVAGNFTVTENVTSGWTLTNVVCSAGGIPVTVPVLGFSGLVNITVVAGQTVTCTFTNKRAPVVKLQKELPNGRFVATDQFTLNVSGVASGTTTTGTGNAATGVTTLNPATAGTALTLSETGAGGASLANYDTSYSCTNATAGSATAMPSGSGSTFNSLTPQAGDDITCKFVNAAKPRVRVQKTTQGGIGGAFTFSQTNLASNPASITTTAAGTAAPPTPTAINVVTTGAAVTLTETPAAGWTLASASCIDANSAATGNTGTFATLVGNVLTIPAGNVKAGADFTCVFTNSKMPTVKVQKITQGGVGGPFTFSQTNLASAPVGITTTAAATATPATPAAINVTALGTAVTLTEAPPAGWTLTSATCTDANGSTTGNSGPIGSLSSGVLTIPAAAVKVGADFTCVFTNTKQPTVTVTKRSLGGIGTFAFTGTNGFSSQSITTATPGTGVAGATQPLTAPGIATTITESAPPAGFSLTAISCTGLGAGGTATPTINGASGGNVVLNAAATAAGSDIACTFTNTKTATVQLRKTWLGATVNDAVNVTATGLTPLASVANTASETDTGTAQTVTVGSVITIGETFTTGNAAGYTSALSCTGTSGLSGNVLTVGDADTAIVCTETNTRKTATITLAKTWVGATVNDAVNVTATGLTPLASVANTASETDTGTAQTVTVGSVITIGETFTTGNAAGYTSALSCTGTSGLSGNVLTVGASDTAIVCTETNTRKTATITLAKTWVGATVNDAVNVTATGLTPLASVANTASETDTG
ncbi:hypothetical protein J2W27_006494, partial [Variovorax boronicumulans]|uniref:beta strand repeat-containing protein n=1 Tax=Variovorax boronicumulans TaxID=436515 RepID=UPI00277D8A41|nr:hypothetical protein [Variovorax boronicumulans]